MMMMITVVVVGGWWLVVYQKIQKLPNGLWVYIMKELKLIQFYYYYT